MSNPNPPIEISLNTPPDWDARTADLLCPLCKYNLRHLTVARCPECGFTFRWQELLDAERDRHQYVFEHGRRQNLKSFWRTYWRTCQPRRFWSDLNPAQPVNLVRLMVYWFITAGVATLCLSGPKINGLVQTTRQNIYFRQWLIPVPNQPGVYTQAGSNSWTITAADLRAQWPVPWQLPFWEQAFSYRSYLYPGTDSTAFGWALIFLAWPWLTLIALLIFRISMRQAKIRRVHLLRTVVYSCDFGFLLGLSLLAVILRDMHLSEGWIILLGAILCGLVTTYRLTIAFRQYLRVHLPFPTVLASQLIAVLIIFLLLIQIADFSRRV